MGQRVFIFFLGGEHEEACSVDYILPLRSELSSGNQKIMSWLQIHPFGPYLSSFAINSYGYYSQISQNLVSKPPNFRFSHDCPTGC